MAPVIAALRRRFTDARHVLVHTGQHYDREMSDVFLSDLGVPDPDYVLEVGSGSHALQTARVMERFEPVLLRERPDLVIVPGDVNSTLAAVLVAVKLGVPIAHVESGLRSFDRTMPEEINRIVADQFAQFLFVHSDDAVENLRREGVCDDRIHFVGNTMIDALVAVEPRWREAGVASRLGLVRNAYVLVTLHRPSLVDHPLLDQVADELDALAQVVPVVFPVHPRTQRRLGNRPGGRVRFLEPLSYIDFISLEADAAAVLTDSGGVQEETTFLGVPCFTLRANTERPVTLRRGTNRLLGLEPRRIAEIAAVVEATPRVRARTSVPLWDGRSGERVADVIEAVYGGSATDGDTAG